LLVSLPHILKEKTRESVSWAKKETQIIEILLQIASLVDFNGKKTNQKSLFKSSEHVRGDLAAKHTKKVAETNEDRLNDSAHESSNLSWSNTVTKRLWEKELEELHNNSSFFCSPNFI
jgi:hypothetical protein